MSDRQPFWTPANVLTLARLPLAGLIWVAASNVWWLLAVMSAAGITDIFDGWAARRYRKRHGIDESEPGHGVWLDPLCDKVFVISVLAAVFVSKRPPVFVLPLIASREIIQIAAILLNRAIPRIRRYMRFDPRAAVIGKVNTVFQFLAVGSILIGHPAWPTLTWIAGAAGLLAGLYYVRRSLLRE